MTQSHSNFWHDPEPLEANGYSQLDVNVNHPVGLLVFLPQEFTTVRFRSNVTIQIKLTRLAIRGLLGSNKLGVVVLLGSTAGYAKQYMAPIYSASKHAITGFTKSMGDAEKHQRVRVIAICPG
jgi:short-subunit dehydrogenase